MEPNKRSEIPAYAEDLMRRLEEMLKDTMNMPEIRRSMGISFGYRPPKTRNVSRSTGITMDDEHQRMAGFQCNVLDCEQVFHNLADYEIHYNRSHRHTCEECKITRPNAKLLEIHIQESHDSFFPILSQKQPMFQCYMKKCNKKFSSSQERSSHCMTIHNLPENFDFGNEKLKTAGIESMGRERRSVTPIPEDSKAVTDGKTP